MTNVNVITQATRLRSTVVKVLSFGSVLVIAVLIAAHLAWKYAGSNKWTLEIDKNGIKIYSLKAPGSVLKDWKAVRRVKLTLNRAVAAIMSTDNEDSVDWDPRSASVKAIQPFNSQDLTYIHLYRLDLPAPFSPREILVKGKASQDPKSKAVVVEFIARPNELPQNQCCVRITKFQHTWRFTTLGDGEIEVECVSRHDLKVPYVFVNRVAPGALYELFSRLPRLLNKEKWNDARFASISEE
jgi:hypothetical protein